MQDDGTVNIHVIRPTIGQGLGRHKYSPEMLRENADVFTGWKMYIDHQSPEAKKAAGGLPRSIRDLGGRIMESWWDDTVPASGRYERGAVVAKVKPVGQVKKLIEEDPGLLEASIRAKATEVHEAMESGEQVWVVEGIRSDPPGSVDWVSEGGAGGRVADLIEGLVREEPAEGGEMLKELQEALTDSESDVSKAVREIVTERTAGALKKADERHAAELAEAKVAATSEVESQKAALDLRDKRFRAHRLIEAAALPTKATAKLKREYDVKAGVPTPKLNQNFDALRESVGTDIQETKEALAEVAPPTAVEGQGPSGTDGDRPAAPAEKPFYEEFLEEAGIDPDMAYGNSDMKESV